MTASSGASLSGLSGPASGESPAISWGDPVVVRLHGEHDLSTVAELAEMLAMPVALGTGDVVVDLRRVTFLSSSTVGVFIRTRDVLLERSRRLMIRRPSSMARRVLGIGGIGDLIEPNRDEICTDHAPRAPLSAIAFKGR